MRNKVLFRDDETDEVLLEGKTLMLPNVGELVVIGNLLYKVKQRLFRYNPPFCDTNEFVCDVWLDKEKK